MAEYPDGPQGKKKKKQSEMRSACWGARGGWVALRTITVLIPRPNLLFKSIKDNTHIHSWSAGETLQADFSLLALVSLNIKDRS